MIKTLLITSAFALSIFAAKAQDNYEIQVYGSETVEKGRTMLELHSNFTGDGTKVTEDGVLPTNHAIHETIEITHGWTACFETGFYFFNSLGSDGRTAYVGSHLRPRIAAPESWKLPVGLSLSTEFGFQKAAFAGSTFDLEIRPIIDKKWGGLYASFNPTLGKSFAGQDSNIGYVFEPNLKASYDVTKVVALGFEYYGSTGVAFDSPPIGQQQHALYIATDLNFSADWEVNAGYGFGLTNVTDGKIIKLIIGRRF